MPGINCVALSRSDLDVSDAQAVDDYLQYEMPERLINAAAYTAVDRAESEPELAEAINHQGAANLARNCAVMGIPLVHVSTDYVFDGAATQAYSETDETRPMGQYGISKLAGEAAVAELCPAHVIVRTAWVYSEYGHNFVKTMLSLAGQHSQLRVVDDQIGGPVYAGDLAQALLDIICLPADKLQYGIYHFGADRERNWCQFARDIFSEARRIGLIEAVPEVKGISTAEYPTAARRPAYSVLDSSLLLQDYGIHPSSYNRSLGRVLRALTAAD